MSTSFSRTGEARAAYRALLAVLSEVEQRFAGPEWGVGPADEPDAFRRILHALEASLLTQFEADPLRPRFERIVSPTRKFEGDNPDAVYFHATVHPRGAYRIRGNLAGAVYTSFTLEAGTADGAYSTHTAGAIHDRQLDVAADGLYELWLGGAPRARNWLGLADDVWRVQSRHYFEEKTSRAADPLLHIPLAIERCEPIGPPPRPDDASVGAGIRRAANSLAGLTIARPPLRPEQQPAFVGTVPNQFPKPVSPGSLGFSAPDSFYSMAPYALGPREALVVEMRWPRCRFANVVLFNRQVQTYDYAHRQVSLNRAQAKLDADGSFRLVIAHRDLGAPNWLDTEGRESGHVFWRFFLPEGTIETPRARVVHETELR